MELYYVYVMIMLMMMIIIIIIIIIMFIIFIIACILHSTIDEVIDTEKKKGKKDKDTGIILYIIYYKLY